MSLALLLWACAGPSSVGDTPPRLIAHSGGIGNHRTYTNSLEALDNSVARGHTAIEVDLSWTSDQHLVLLHDWSHEFEKLFDRSPGRLTLVEFRSLPSAVGFRQHLPGRVDTTEFEFELAQHQPSPDGVRLLGEGLLRPAMGSSQLCVLISGRSTYCQVRLRAPYVKNTVGHSTSAPTYLVFVSPQHCSGR